MKFTSIKTGALSTMLIASLFACNSTSKDGFETDSKTAVQYHFFTHNESGTKAQMGDYVELELTLKNSKDSLIFTSANHKRRLDDSITNTIRLHLKNPYQGCLDYGLTMMSVGDSASFKLNADSLYTKNFHSRTVPSFVDSGSMLTCNVKLVKIESQEEAKAHREKRIAEREAKDAQRKAGEMDTINKYLSDNHLNIKPEADGMYILSDKKGKGKKVAQEGDSVEVKYTAMLLDNTVVDESDHGDLRTTYTFAFKKDPQLKGIEDAIGNMKEGEEIKALFPSSLAFGNQQQGPLVEPYTPLLFDITLVKITSAK